MTTATYSASDSTRASPAEPPPHERNASAATSTTMRAQCVGRSNSASAGPSLVVWKGTKNPVHAAVVANPAFTAPTIPRAVSSSAWMRGARAPCLASRALNQCGPGAVGVIRTAGTTARAMAVNAPCPERRRGSPRCAVGAASGRSRHRRDRRRDRGVVLGSRRRRAARRLGSAHELLTPVRRPLAVRGWPSRPLAAATCQPSRPFTFGGGRRRVTGRAGAEHSLAGWNNQVDGSAPRSGLVDICSSRGCPQPAGSAGTRHPGASPWPGP